MKDNPFIKLLEAELKRQELIAAYTDKCVEFDKLYGNELNRLLEQKRSTAYCLYDDYAKLDEDYRKLEKEARESQANMDMWEAENEVNFHQKVVFECYAEYADYFGIDVKYAMTDFLFEVFSRVLSEMTDERDV